MADGGCEVRAAVISDGENVGWASWMHVDAPRVSADQTIDAGTPIGTTSRFRTTSCHQVSNDAGAHVHLEARDSTHYACSLDVGS